MPPEHFFILKLLFLIAAGFVAGFYGVSVNGGGLITVPALIFTGMPIHLVIATNRFAVVWGELTGAIGFRKYSSFDRRFALLCGLVGSVGAFAGSRIMLRIDEDILSIVIAVLLVAVALFLLKQRRWGEGRAELSSSRKIVILLCMPFIGLYAGFFGTAHGVFSLILLTAGGIGFLQSAAINRVIGLMVAVTAALSFMEAGVIQWPQSVALAIGWVVGGWLGVRFSVKHGVGVFRWMLIIVAFASAGKLLWQVV